MSHPSSQQRWPVYLALVSAVLVNLLFGPAARAGEAADAALANGEYERALDLYRAELGSDDEVVDPVALHFNMGLAHANLQSLGWAVYHLTQARYLAPGDTEIHAALASVTGRVYQERAEGSVGQSVTTGEPSQLYWLGFFHRYSRLGVELGIIVFSWVFLALLFLRGKFKRHLARDTILVIAALTLLALLGSLTYWVGGRITSASVAPGVVVAESPMLREGPDRRSARGRNGDLYQGALVIIRADREEWLEVELANGRRGWLSNAAVRRIRLD